MIYADGKWPADVEMARAKIEADKTQIELLTRLVVAVEAIKQEFELFNQHRRGGGSGGAWG